MDNSLYELLIARHNGTKTQLLKVLLIASLAFLGIVILILFPAFLPIILILGVLAYIFVFPKFNIEYEYTLLYQNLDIDIIYNKAKRKSIETVDLSEAEIIAPANSQRLKTYRPTKVLDYSTQRPTDTPYAIIVPLRSNLTKILIQPDEAMIAHLRNVAPRLTFTD